VARLRYEGRRLRTGSEQGKTPDLGPRRATRTADRPPAVVSCITTHTEDYRRSRLPGVLLHMPRILLNDPESVNRRMTLSSPGAPAHKTNAPSLPNGAPHDAHRKAAVRQRGKRSLHPPASGGLAILHREFPHREKSTWTRAFDVACNGISVDGPKQSGSSSVFVRPYSPALVQQVGLLRATTFTLRGSKMATKQMTTPGDPRRRKRGSDPRPGVAVGAGPLASPGRQTPLIDDPFAEPLVRAVGVDFFTRLATGGARSRRGRRRRPSGGWPQMAAMDGRAHQAH